MITHQHRLIGLAVAAIVVALELVAPQLHWTDEETAHVLAQATLAALVSLGVIDASLVERRRRDPSKPAIRDDVLSPEACIPDLTADTEGEADAEDESEPE